MRRIVGIGAGDAHEQVLEAFARQEIAVLQRLLAEIGQERVAPVINLDRIGLAQRALGRLCGGVTRGRRLDRVGGHRLAVRPSEIHVRTAPAFPYRSGESMTKHRL